MVCNEWVRLGRFWYGFVRLGRYWYGCVRCVCVFVVWLVDLSQVCGKVVMGNVSKVQMYHVCVYNK